MKSSDRPRLNPEAAPGIGPGEREALARALDALADAASAAHDHLRSTSPLTRALIAQHESWPENVIWTDGSQVAKAARLIAARLRRCPEPSALPAPIRCRPRARRRG